MRLFGTTLETAKQLGFWKSDTVTAHYVSEIVKLPQRLDELRKIALAGSIAYASVEEELRRSGRHEKSRGSE